MKKLESIERQHTESFGLNIKDTESLFKNVEKWAYRAGLPACREKPIKVSASNTSIQVIQAFLGNLVQKFCYKFFLILNQKYQVAIISMASRKMTFVQ